MSDKWSYIARSTKPLKNYPIVGTAVAAVVDDGNHPKMVAEAVRDWINDGLIVERVPIEWVRKYLFTAEPYVSAP